MSMKVADDTLQLARVSVRSLTTSRWKRCISSKTLEDVLVCGGVWWWGGNLRSDTKPLSRRTVNTLKLIISNNRMS